jgi:lysophospholipase L1-like esterase
MILGPASLKLVGAPRAFSHVGRAFLPPTIPTLLPLNSRIVYFGDSITANRGFPGYADWSQFTSRGKFYGKAVGSNGLGPTGWNQGVVGNTTAMLITRIQNVIDEAPKLVVLLVGTNDIGAGGLSASTITTNLRTIINALKAAGIKVLVITILPRIAAGWGQTQNDTKTAVNNWIKAQTDIDWLDSELYVTNPATQLQADGTHPNGAGAQPLGIAVGNKIMTYAAATDILYDPLAAAPSENLYLNPFFTGSTTIASGQVATSWSYFPAANGLTRVNSKTTLDGSAAQKLVLSGTATANVADNFSQNITPPGGLAGELYEAWMEVQFNRITGIAGFALSAGTNTQGSVAMSITSQDTSGGLTVPFTGVLRAPPSVLATNGATFSSRMSLIPINGAVVDAEMIITRAGYRKVPALQ